MVLYISLFALILLVSVFLVKIGSLLLEITGMDPEWARFQALSAFTGTGFTTSEAEGVVSEPLRRRIISGLMLLGSASIVSLISTFVSSLVKQDVEHASISIGALAIIALILWRIAASQRLANLLRRVVKARVEKMELVPTTAIQNLLQHAEGYGIVRVSLDEKSPQIGKTLAELGTTKQDVLVLSIQREEGMIAVPKGPETLRVGDALLCFGRVNSIARVFLWGHSA